MSPQARRIPADHRRTRARVPHGPARRSHASAPRSTRRSRRRRARRARDAPRVEPSSQQSLERILESLPAPALRALPAAAPALLRDALHRVAAFAARRTGTRDSAEIDSDAGARSTALSVPAAARVAERARSLSAQHEREGARRASSTDMRTRFEAAKTGRRRTRDATRCRTASRTPSCGSTTIGRRRRTRSSWRSSSIASRRRSRRSSRWV